ncbi:hypothetical protein TNCV_2198631 [Trichonephila clavipes]|nr:hypothetical protein TNCV_2198631 [Trichonephila clavipes]
MQRQVCVVPSHTWSQSMGFSVQTFPSLTPTMRRYLADSSFPPIIETEVGSVSEAHVIGNVINEVVDPTRVINLEMDSNDVQELLDSHYQKLTIDELEQIPK